VSFFIPLSDTIVVNASLGYKDYLSDNKAEDLPTPIFARQNITNKEKIKAYKRWLTDRAKHKRKKRVKSSFVS
jgi:hypothetical protein